MLNKKGGFEVAKTTIFWMIMVFIITIVIISFALIIGNYQKKVISVPSELQAELISLRFTNIPECFAYTEEGVTQSGIIDLAKFTNEQMKKCYRTETTKTFNFRLLLRDTGKEITSNNYFNKDDFTLFKNVLIKDGTILRKDKLIIYVQEEI